MWQMLHDLEARIKDLEDGIRAIRRHPDVQAKGSEAQEKLWRMANDLLTMRGIVQNLKDGV